MGPVLNACFLGGSSQPQGHLVNELSPTRIILFANPLSQAQVQRLAQCLEVKDSGSAFASGWNSPLFGGRGEGTAPFPGDWGTAYIQQALGEPNDMSTEKS